MRNPRQAALLYAADLLAHEEVVLNVAGSDGSMRLVADENCDFSVVIDLRLAGLDVVSIAGNLVAMLF